MTVKFLWGHSGLNRGRGSACYSPSMCPDEAGAKSPSPPVPMREPRGWPAPQWLMHMHTHMHSHLLPLGSLFPPSPFPLSHLCTRALSLSLLFPLSLLYFSSQALSFSVSFDLSSSFLFPFSFSPSASIPLHSEHLLFLHGPLPMLACTLLSSILYFYCTFFMFRNVEVYKCHCITIACSIQLLPLFRWRNPLFQRNET